MFDILFIMKQGFSSRFNGNYLKSLVIYFEQLWMLMNIGSWYCERKSTSAVHPAGLSHRNFWFLKGQMDWFLNVHIGFSEEFVVGCGRSIRTPYWLSGVCWVNKERKWGSSWHVGLAFCEIVEWLDWLGMCVCVCGWFGWNGWLLAEGFNSLLLQMILEILPARTLPTGSCLCVVWLGRPLHRLCVMWVHVWSLACCLVSSCGPLQ